MIAHAPDPLPSEEYLIRAHSELMALPPDHPARKYWRDHAVSDEVIEKAGIGWGADPYRKEHRIVIPIRDQAGELLQVKWFSPDPSANPRCLSVRGRSVHPYPLHLFRAGSEIVVGEGEPDVLAVHSVGQVNAITTTGGAASISYEKLADQVPTGPGSGVLMVPDADRAGEEWAYRFGQELEAVSVDEIRFINLPTGTDIADFLAALPEEERVEAWFSLMEGANPFETKAKVDDRDGWPDPVPLSRVLELPEFPVDLLPPIEAEWTVAVTEEIQVPLALPGMFSIADEAIALQGKFEAHGGGNWIEPLNGFYLVALESGSRKSAVHSLARRPWRACEDELALELAPVIAAAKAERDVLAAKLKRKKKEASEAAGDMAGEVLAEVKKMQEELDALLVPDQPQLIADNITPENVSTVMAGQGGKLGILSPEGTFFELLAGRYNDSGPVFEDILCAHAGDEIAVNRQGRPRIKIPRPALTLGIAPQPDVVVKMGSKPGFLERGLTNRIVFAIPRSLLGEREVDTEPVPGKVRAAFDSHIQKLFRLPGGDKSAMVLVPPPEAMKLLKDLARRLEPRLGPDGDLHHIKGWAGKLAGECLRIAARFYLSRIHANREVSSVSRVDSWEWKNAMRAAIRLGEGYFIQHAIKAHELMRGDPRITGSEPLVRWLQKRLPRGETYFSKTEAHQQLRHHYPLLEEFEPHFQLLEKHHYVRAREQEPKPEAERKKGGRPRSQTYDINPKLRT